MTHSRSILSRFVLASLLATTTACGLLGGGKVPETRYYQLAHAPASNSGVAAGAVVAIEPLETDQAYDDERIVYRLTPYRLDYYNYHRWSSPPGVLIANYLERAFEQSGRFKTVTREVEAAPVTLGGRVVAIEEIDKSKTSWVGRVVVELTLTDTLSGEVLWSEQFEENEPLKAQTPEGLAQALSIALRRISDRALPHVADRAVDVARKQETGAKATATRAARLRN